MSTLNKVYDIAIIGSGSLSQVCAVLSQHYELDTVLIKANENESKNYDSLMLDDETMRLMNSIGVLENIGEDIFSPYFTDLILPNGKVIQRNLVSKTHNGYNQINFVNQNLLREALDTKIINSSNSYFTEKSELINFDYSNNIYELNLRLDNKLTKLKAHYLIVFDELNSVIKKFPTKIDDLKYNKDWLIVDLVTSQNNILENAFRQVCDPKRPTTQIVTSENKCRFEFQLLAGENKNLFSTKDMIDELLKPFLGKDQYSVLNYFVKNFRGYYCKNIKFDGLFLAGDAAHKIPPYAGHNFNTGIRDILNLIWKIKLQYSSEFSTNILATYETERLTQIKETIKSSIALGQLIDSMSIAYQKNISFEESIPPEAREQAFGDKSVAAQSWISNGLYHSDIDDTLLTKRLPKVSLMKDGVTCELDEMIDFKFAIVSDQILNQEKLISGSEILQNLKIKFINLSEYSYSNDFLSELIEVGSIIVRPDKKIFGVSTSDLSIDKLLEDLANQLS